MESTTIEWQQITKWLGWAVAAALLIAKIAKEIFGVDTIGKKGFTLTMKYLFRNAEHRKATDAKLSFIVDELKYNGGGSTKDAIKRVELLQSETISQLKKVALIAERTAVRMDIADIANERMTFKIDPSGACIKINEIFLKFFGYNERDILGYGFENCIHPEDLPDVQEKWKRAIQAKGRFYDEQRIKCNINQGEYIPCIVRGFPSVGADGELILFMGYIEPIAKK